MGFSHASGFSIGESDNDKLKYQLKNLTSTFEEEKQRKDTILVQQSEEIDKTAKDIMEASEL